MPSRSILSTRLRTIVDVVFDGNAARAADVVGLPASAFHRLLTGNIANPRIRTVQNLADGFGVSAEWLLGGPIVSQARAGGDEAYQLLRAYHTAEQAPLRRQLKESAKKGRHARPVFRQLASEFYLDPLNHTSALYSILVPLLEAQPLDEHRLHLVRALLAAETTVLELAIAEIKTK